MNNEKEIIGEGVNFERIRRITGYLGSVDKFNDAKKAEVKDRVLHSNEKEIKLETTKTLEETDEFYQNKILPILNISKKYNIDFCRELPFEDFGSDAECCNYTLFSFSDFYNELLPEGLIKSINTEEISAGKYMMNVEDSAGNVLLMDVFAWDDMNGVIRNIEVIESTLIKDNQNDILDINNEL